TQIASQAATGCGRIGGDSTTGISEARADQASGQRAEDESPGEEGVRRRAVAAKQFGATEFNGVVAFDNREIVGNFKPAAERILGEKDVGPNIVDKSGNLQTRLSGGVGVNMEEIVVVLKTKFVLFGGAELMIPGSQPIVVIIARGAAR